MAMVAQQRLFDWQDIVKSGDLVRLQLVLENMPDEPLMQKHEHRHGFGRDKYPLRGF